MSRRTLPVILASILALALARNSIATDKQWVIMRGGVWTEAKGFWISNGTRCDFLCPDFFQSDDDKRLEVFQATRIPDGWMFLVNVAQDAPGPYVVVSKGGKARVIPLGIKRDSQIWQIIGLHNDRLYYLVRDRNVGTIFSVDPDKGGRGTAIAFTKADEVHLSQGKMLAVNNPHYFRPSVTLLSGRSRARPLDGTSAVWLEYFGASWPLVLRRTKAGTDVVTYGQQGRLSVVVRPRYPITRLLATSDGRWCFCARKTGGGEQLGLMDLRSGTVHFLDKIFVGRVEPVCTVSAREEADSLCEAIDSLKRLSTWK